MCINKKHNGNTCGSPLGVRCVEWPRSYLSTLVSVHWRICFWLGPCTGSDLYCQREFICSFPISSITALFFLSTPSIPIRETESCNVMHGQHFAEQDGRKKDLGGCTLVDKDLETKDVP